MEKYGFVYLWRDRKHNRYYVGSHWGTEDDGYVCSSKWMRNAYRIRSNDFRRRIIARVYTNRSDLLKLEETYLSMIHDSELRIKYYNISKSIKDPWFQYPEKLKTISEKISVKTKEAMRRPEVRAKYENAMAMANHSHKSNPCVIKKRRQSMIKTMAKKFPEENRRKPLTEEERTQYYSDKAKAMHASRSDAQKAEIGAKISQANFGKQMRLGQSNSTDHRRKISESLKGKIHPRHAISIDGVVYESTVKAAEVLGLSVATINRRLSSHKYLEYLRVGS